MNWSMLFIAFALAVIMGMAFAALLAQLRPQWSARRRLLAAALGLPAVTLAATLMGLAVVQFSGPASGENMKDLALAATAALGGFFTLLAFVGGLLGATIAHRKRGR